MASELIEIAGVKVMVAGMTLAVVPGPAVISSSGMEPGPRRLAWRQVAAGGRVPIKAT